jgi:hypothetical protein
MPLEQQPAEELSIGRAVTVPDGRAGVIRFVYPAERGTNLIVRVEDSSMLVVPAAKCRLMRRSEGQDAEPLI